ncbi:MAG TPA: hypothetical protein VEP89_06740 [Draconibacterium sp.]|nr:hypothetical protein [Draconibacterium sp.]
MKNAVFFCISLIFMSTVTCSEEVGQTNVLVQAEQDTTAATDPKATTENETKQLWIGNP